MPIVKQIEKKKVCDINPDIVKLKDYYNSIKGNQKIVEEWKQFFKNDKEAFNQPSKWGNDLHHKNQLILDQLVPDKNFQFTIRIYLKIFSDFFRPKRIQNRKTN